MHTITCLDIIIPGRSRNKKQNKDNQYKIGINIKELQEKQRSQLVEEQPQPADEAPIIERNHNELTATGVASLAVVLLLGAALVAMRTLSKKQSSPVP